PVPQEPIMSHRPLLVLSFLAAAFVLGGFHGRSLAADQVLDPSAAKPDEKGAVLWYDVKNLELEGKGWGDTKNYFDRFPTKAEVKVRPEVWSLSRNSAGMAVRF